MPHLDAPSPMNSTTLAPVQRVGHAADATGLPRSGVALISLAAALAYAGAVSGSFAFDDPALVRNLAAGPGRPTLGDVVGSPLWASDGAFQEGIEPAYRLLHRPAIKLLFYLAGPLGDAAPYVLRGVGLGAHAAFTWALLGYVARRPGAAVPAEAAFAAVAFAAMHPSRAESVTNVGGLSDVLCGLGLLLALRAFARGGWAGHVLGALSIAFAGSAKELAVVAPVLVGLDAYARRLGTRAILLRTTSALVGVAFFALPWLAATSSVARPELASTSAMRVISTLGAFVRRTILPWPPSLEPAALDATSTAFGLSTGADPVLGVALLTSATYATVRAFRTERRDVLLALAWFVVPLAPVSNVLVRSGASAMADRFLYVPLVGVALAIALALGAIPSEARRRGAIGSVALAAALGFIASEYASARFADDVALYSSEVRVHPASPRATVPLVRALAGAGRLRDAEQAAVAALRSAARLGSAGDELAAFLSLLEVQANYAHDFDQSTLTRVRRAYDTIAERGELVYDAPSLRYRRVLPPGLRASVVREGRRFILPRAVAHARTLDDRGAETMLRAHLANHEDDPRAIESLALIVARRGAYDEAVTELARGRRLRPSDDGLVRAAALVTEVRPIATARLDDPRERTMRDANVLARLGSPAAARARLSPLLEGTGVPIEALAVAAQIEEADGRLDAARTLVAEGLSYAPGHPLFLALDARYRGRP